MLDLSSTRVMKKAAQRCISDGELALLSSSKALRLRRTLALHGETEHVLGCIYSSVFMATCKSNDSLRAFQWKPHSRCIVTELLSHLHVKVGGRQISHAAQVLRKAVLQALLKLRLATAGDSQACTSDSPHSFRQSLKLCSRRKTMSLRAYKLPAAGLELSRGPQERNPASPWVSNQQLDNGDLHKRDAQSL